MTYCEVRHWQPIIIIGMESSVARLSALNPSRTQALNSTFESEKPTSELRDERFSIRKELYRGIKDNDVDKIVVRAGDGGPEEDFRYDEYAHVHNVLTEKRKNFDDHKTATNARRKEIEGLKKEIDELAFVEASLQRSIASSRDTLEGVADGLSTAKEECEYTVFRKEVYNHVLERTKETYLVEKKRMFDVELNVQKVRSQHRAVMMEATNKRRLEKQCRKMLASIEKVVDIEKKRREDRLLSMQDVIDKKQEAIRKKSDREREIAFLVDAASNEKSMQEKEWGKVFMANKLLNCILRSKISRELARHSRVEKTFQTIKLNTGVGQADVLVEKYLLREQTYGSLLASIAEKEPLLEKAQAWNEELKGELRELSEQETAEGSLSKKHLANDEISRKEKALEQLATKTILYERQREAFYQWAIKFLKKHDSLLGESQRTKLNYFEVYPRSHMETLYRKVEAIIQDSLEEAGRNVPCVPLSRRACRRSSWRTGWAALWARRPWPGTCG